MMQTGLRTSCGQTGLSSLTAVSMVELPKPDPEADPEPDPETQAQPAKALSLLASAELEPLEKALLQAALTQHQV